MRTRISLNSWLWLPVVAMAFLTSCSKFETVRGKGSIASETRQLNQFDKVESDISGDIEIVHDSQFFVEVSDHHNILPYIVTDVYGSKLHIRFTRHTHVRNSRAHIVVHLPRLEGVELDGSGKMTCQDDFPDLRNVELTGSGDIDIPSLTGNGDLRTEITGSGNIHVAGSARELTAEITGSGNLDLLYLNVTEAEIRISGSGDAYVYPQDYLYARISGSGDVYYRGTPVVETSISGSGKVRRY